ncbi:MAG: efflux transporter outer membrane subunit [Burkholderiales bacterium]|nr:efflux transporter outer membrane subunit [Burkholderiales bacterium]
MGLRVWRGWLAISLPAWLAACAVQSPAPATAPVPPQWYAPLPHGGQLPELGRWWQQFDDPLLVELVEAAQTASPTVAQARSRIEQARLARVNAGAQLGPRLDGTGSASRGVTDPTVPIPVTLVQAGLQARWEIDVFGGLGAARDAVQARLEGSQAGWHDARVIAAAEVANQYYSRRTCEKLQDVAESDARSRAETARLAGLSANAGFQAPATAALARASAAEGAMRLTQQRAQCAVDLKALVAMTALPEPLLAQKLAAARAGLPLPAPFAVQEIPAPMLAQRPDVYTAEREVAAAGADVGTAQAQRFPRLTLSGSVGIGRYYAGGESGSVKTWSIGPLAMTVPLLDGGAAAAGVRASEARYDEAVALYQARVRQAVREVEEALVNLDSARARSEDAANAIEGYRISFTATEARYRSGLASLVELEDARRTALAAETALVNLQRERVAAWIALYRAVGGGWARPGTDTAATRP